MCRRDGRKRRLPLRRGVSLDLRGNHRIPLSAYASLRQRSVFHAEKLLPGFLAESLPDGYGLWLMDQAFQKAGVPREAVTPLDRLAFVGNRATGALSYEPAGSTPPAKDSVPLTALDTAAQHFLETEETELFPELVACGSAGGSRPKAHLWFGDDFTRASLVPKEDMTARLVKFTAPDFPLAHEEGLFEAAAFSVAEKAGIRNPHGSFLKALKAEAAPRPPTGSGWNGSTVRPRDAFTTCRPQGSSTPTSGNPSSTILTSCASLIGSRSRREKWRSFSEGRYFPISSKRRRPRKELRISSS